MSKGKKQKKEYLDPSDRFRQIANHRAKNIVKYVNLLRGMLPQPSYDITDVDAEKLATYLDENIIPLMSDLQKLAKGESLKGAKKDIKDVF
jgi:hypothetical protein